jgi:hypothetical protein
VIRYFEVLGLNDDVEYFGFVDTVTTRVIEIEGEQLMCDYEDFLSRQSHPQWGRLNGLIPERMKP